MELLKIGGLPVVRLGVGKPAVNVVGALVLTFQVLGIGSAELGSDTNRQFNITVVQLFRKQIDVLAKIRHAVFQGRQFLGTILFGDFDVNSFLRVFDDLDFARRLLDLNRPHAVNH